MIVLPILYLKAVWKTLSDGLKYSISTKGQSMTPQEQKNRLNDIMFHAQRCELYDDEHRLYAKMGLGITIYFYGGGSENGLTKPLKGEL